MFCFFLRFDNEANKGPTSRAIILNTPMTRQSFAINHLPLTRPGPFVFTPIRYRHGLKVREKQISITELISWLKVYILLFSCSCSAAKVSLVVRFNFIMLKTFRSPYMFCPSASSSFVLLEVVFQFRINIYKLNTKCF